MAILASDSVSGYSLRCVCSVSSTLSTSLKIAYIIQFLGDDNNKTIKGANINS